MWHVRCLLQVKLLEEQPAQVLRVLQLLVCRQQSGAWAPHRSSVVGLYHIPMEPFCLALYPTLTFTTAYPSSLHTHAYTHMHMHPPTHTRTHRASSSMSLASATRRMLPRNCVRFVRACHLVHYRCVCSKHPYPFCFPALEHTRSPWEEHQSHGLTLLAHTCPLPLLMPMLNAHRQPLQPAADDQQFHC